MNNKIKSERIGEKIISNQGYNIEIIDYTGVNNCTVRFDSGLILSGIQYIQIKKKNIVNPFHLTYYSIGYFGVGEAKMMENRKLTKCFSVWCGMLERCYSENYHIKKPTYKGCTTSDEWLNYQNFARWYEENFKPEYMENWQLDKDIICFDCRHYSAETCCFVPNEINSIFKSSKSYRGSEPIGVFKVKDKYLASYGKKGKRISLGTFNTAEEAFIAYKIKREDFVKEVAKEWKDKIDPRVYQAMCNYKININD